MGSRGQSAVELQGRGCDIREGPSYSYTNENNDQKRGLCAHHHQSVARERRGAVEPLGHNHALAHDVTRTARLTVDVRPDLPPASYTRFTRAASRAPDLPCAIVLGGPSCLR